MSLEYRARASAGDTTTKEELEKQSSTQSGAIAVKNFVFIECFAGEAPLSRAMSRIGFQTDTPQDIDTGGIDFSCEYQLLKLWEHWKTLRLKGFDLLFHFAPPCSSFSRARDRSTRTRLRSSSAPGGLYPNEPKTSDGNRVARHTAMSIRYLVRELGAKGTLEQPASSYMLPYLDQEDLLDEHGQVLLHQCRFGRPYRKPTVFLTFGGLELPTLARTCTSEHSCGRSFHTQLGFGEGSTCRAAAYPEALCAAYAGAVHRALGDNLWNNDEQVERLVVTTKGTVERHIDRGSGQPSLRARRAAEDAASHAGLVVFKCGKMA